MVVVVNSGSPSKKMRLDDEEEEEEEKDKEEVMDGDKDDCMDVEPEAHLEKPNLQEKGLSLDLLHPSQQPDNHNSLLIGGFI